MVGKQTYRQLAQKYGYSIKTIQRRLDTVKVEKNTPIIKPIIVNIKKKSLKISSSYYNDKYYNNNIKNRIIEIKNNNITKLFYQNNEIDNQENRSSRKESSDNRREIDENNKIITMSDKIGRKRSREEEKDKNITKYDIGSFYLYEDSIAYLSGLKVVFHDNESSSYLILDKR